MKRAWLATWWHRLSSAKRPPVDGDRAIREEIRFHVEMRYAEYLREGMTHEQARQAALERFGDAGRVWLECREADGIADERIAATRRKGDSFMSTQMWDIRYALRMMRKTPGFSVVVILTLALGIGANTAIFSVINGVLLEPLPWKDADRIVRVWESNPARGFPFFSASPPNWADWKAQSQSFEYLCNFRGAQMTYTGAGEPERLVGALVSHDFFTLLGVKPLAGRFFLLEEDAPGKNLVAVISEGLWRRRFGAETSVVGRVITLNGQPYSIVGIAPDQVWIPNRRTELWSPSAFDGQTLTQARGAHFIGTIGRLKPGVTLEQAEAELKGIASRLEKQYPASNTGWTTRMLTVYETLVGDVRSTLWTLFGAVFLVLLIACANVANLMLVRASARQREIAIQAALGTSRGRVARQLLTESLLLALSGAVAGLLLAWWGIGALRQIGPDVGIPRAWQIALDPLVLAFAFGMALLTGVIFGVFPVLQLFRSDLYEGLKEGGRSGTGRVRQRMRSALVVTEVALSLILLVGAGLFIRSIGMMRGVDLGLKTDRRLTFQVVLPQTRYPDLATRVPFMNRALEQLKAVPGVQSAALVTNLPLAGDYESYSFGQAGLPADPNAPSVDYAIVSPEYFATAGIPLLQGRNFGDQDTATAPRVVVINKDMADRFYKGENPIGKRIQIGRNYSIVREIIGVVGDVRKNGIGEAPGNQAYEVYTQVPNGVMSFMLHTSLPPESLIGEARNAIWSVDKDLPVGRVLSMDKVVANNFSQPMFRTVLLGTFSAIALALAAVGLYGVMAYSVERRTHEIGLRMALGAQRSDILRMVLRSGLALAVLGVTIGTLGALWLSRFVATQLFEVQPQDPLTFAAVAAFLALIALLACWTPARRATRVDPLVALRYE